MNNHNVAVFAGGCFWCTEAIYSRLNGVFTVQSGYTGGSVHNPTYEQISAGNTGHAEAIKIEFDPKIIKYCDLLNVFFTTHDPTTPNRQGNDVGDQYRSAIFYTSNTQQKQALGFIKKLEVDKIFDGSIITQVERLDKFWPAESYHNRYYELNKDKPYCRMVIEPKIAKLRAKFTPFLKQMI